MVKVFDVGSFRTFDDTVMAEIKSEILKLLGDTMSGCFVLTLDGPKGSEELYWRAAVSNNAQRISEALGVPVAPQTEYEARTLYLKWCDMIE
jgi:hypothetical protein